MTRVPGGRPEAVSLLPVDGVGEVGAHSDLTALLCAAVELRDGDVLVVTSKVVSKSEGRVRNAARDEAVAEETDRVVATRGRTAIVRTRHGLVMAAAGVDASNTDAGTVVLLPLDPDASARRLRDRIAERSGRNVAVVVTDTAGRAWRHGQTDIAIGAAGLEVLHDYAGVTDPHGNELAVTAPAVADELAAAGDLVKRKLDGRPAAVVRGLAPLVLPRGSHGPGARALVREESQDMFGLGAREAVLAALDGEDVRGFGAPAAVDDLVARLLVLADGAADVRVERDGAVAVRIAGSGTEAGALGVRLRTAAFALGWPPELHDAHPLVRFRPATP